MFQRNKIGDISSFDPEPNHDMYNFLTIFRVALISLKLSEIELNFTICTEFEKDP